MAERWGSARMRWNRVGAEVKCPGVVFWGRLVCEPQRGLRAADRGEAGFGGAAAPAGTEGGGLGVGGRITP